MNIKQLRKEVKELDKQYQFTKPSIWDEDTEGKRLMFCLRELDPADRTIMMLYAEHRSLRKVGELLGCSYQSVKNELDRIKEIMIDRYNVIKECF